MNVCKRKEQEARRRAERCDNESIVSISSEVVSSNTEEDRVMNQLSNQGGNEGTSSYSEDVAESITSAKSCLGECFEEFLDLEKSKDSPCNASSEDIRDLAKTCDTFDRTDEDTYDYEDLTQG